jgi:hypothetical protein
MPQQQRSRRDHILPQGYLDGFTGTNGLLQVFNIKEQSWFPAKTANVAAIRGFYDYSEDANPDQTADQAFQEFEDKFPNLRRELIASTFANWRSHLDFLIRYINMFRVRSELFRQHVLQSLEETPPMVVDQVMETKPHPTDPGRVMQKVSVKPMEQTGEQRKTVYTNLSISKMRADMREVPKFFFDFDWCLRYTTDPNKPIITADDAIRLELADPSPDKALKHFQTQLYFPLCWQACLIGSPGHLMPKTKAFSPSRLGELRGKYLRSDCRFAYSPVIVSDLKE